jgi:thiol-disulfide isomerase/thioredoxin
LIVTATPVQVSAGLSCSGVKRARATIVTLLAILVTSLPVPAQSADATWRPWTGGRTPALVLNDADRRAHNLADYRGKVVLVNFWATWCEPCRDEMPALQRVQESLADKGLVVLTVNVGDSEEKAAAFFQQAGLSLPVVFDKDWSVSRSLWKVRMLPSTYIVDRKGVIRYSILGEVNWDAPSHIASLTRLLAAR